jgi:putative acyl-CoA dehydrogenase
VEDTGFPRLLRDAQVLPIWEGTTNVLSLDVLRALGKTDALEHFLAEVRARLARVEAPELTAAAERARDAAACIEAYAGRVVKADSALQQAGARTFAYALARTCAASLLLEHASWAAANGPAAAAVVVAQRWCARRLAPLVDRDPGFVADSDLLAR